jgi:hypothetical protein
MPRCGSFELDIDYQVYFQDGGEEIGAVRSVAADHLVVYIEGAKDFVVPATAVHAAHNGKVILDQKKVNPDLLEAARHAHDRETE